MVEFISSLNTNGILQDTYSNVFVLNIVGFIASSVNEQIDKDSTFQKRKH